MPQHDIRPILIIAAESFATYAEPEVEVSNPEALGRLALCQHHGQEIVLKGNMKFCKECGVSL